MTAVPQPQQRRPAIRSTPPRAETPAEYEERKLAELDRELCRRLWDHAGGKAAPVKLSAIYGDWLPAWVSRAVDRCIRDGMLTADQDGRVTLTPTGVAAAKASEADTAAWLAWEERRRRDAAERNRAVNGGGGTGHYAA